MRAENVENQVKTIMDGLEKAVLDFANRTVKHIKLVQDCALLLVEGGVAGISFLEHVIGHDRSKFSAEEALPYARYWNFLDEHGREDADEKAAFGVALKHHYRENRHHPEGWSDQSQMGSQFVLEMVCDWGAMALEFGTSLRAWAEKMFIKFDFGEQKGLIEAAVDILEPIHVVDGNT